MSHDRNRDARGVGRPPLERKLEKLVAYMAPAELAIARRAVKAAHARSLSSWASEVLAREARRVLRTGLVPRGFLDLPIGSDPAGSVRKALREERDRGW